MNGSGSQVVTSDGLHLVAYVGDADGNGSYSNKDATLITRALVMTDDGFAAYPLVDPVIVADTDGAGSIPSDAALQVNEAGSGLPTFNLAMPPIPSGVVFQVSTSNMQPALAATSVLHTRTAATRNTKALIGESISPRAVLADQEASKQEILVIWNEGFRLTHRTWETGALE
jgi:hypothetical protein